MSAHWRSTERRGWPTNPQPGALYRCQCGVMRICGGVNVCKWDGHQHVADALAPCVVDDQIAEDEAKWLAKRALIPDFIREWWLGDLTSFHLGLFVAAAFFGVCVVLAYVRLGP